MIEKKKWYKSWTVWVGILQIVAAALLLLADFLGKAVFTPEAWVLLAAGIIQIILRMKTTQPLG